MRYIIEELLNFDKSNEDVLKALSCQIKNDVEMASEIIKKPESELFKLFYSEIFECIYARYDINNIRLDYLVNNFPIDLKWIYIEDKLKLELNRVQNLWVELFDKERVNSKELGALFNDEVFSRWVAFDGNIEAEMKDANDIVAFFLWNVLFCKPYLSSNLLVVATAVFKTIANHDEALNRAFVDVLKDHFSDPKYIFDYNENTELSDVFSVHKEVSYGGLHIFIYSMLNVLHFKAEVEMYPFCVKKIDKSGGYEYEDMRHLF